MRNPFSRSRGGSDPQQQLQQLVARLRARDDGNGGGDGRGDDDGDDRRGGRGDREHSDASAPPFLDRWRDKLHERRYEYVQDPADVKLDLREHVVTLAQPLLRTISGVVALVAPHPAAPMIVFAVIVAALARRQRRLDLGQTLIVAVVAGLAIAYAGSGQTSTTVRVVLVVLLLLWLLLDLYVWYDDRLIVTSRRIYRVYGAITKHGPSMALSSVTYIDVELPPLGQAFNYGTLVLDSAAQRDDPLSHFAYLPDAVQVHKQILALRAAALRTLPRPQDMI